jgi:nondiscriminating glutamyl-tRNA synthetase
MTTRTRFAPSPTGELHLGNARIAVLNWLYARHSGGQFILRIEDTDVDRNLPDSEAEIIAALRALGIDWNEGPDIGGPRGPYRQSERATVYAEYTSRLIEEGAAFRCYCTPEELEAKRQIAQARGEKAIYDGTCHDLEPTDEQRHREQGRIPAIRFRVPDDEILVDDVVRGKVTFAAGEFGDFVIVKSDGNPTYNFAVVVDDCAMEVSHVIRGVGHLANTPRQVMIYEALGEDPPVFVHVPHVLGPDGSPLSKRHGARSLQQYLAAGYHPDALVNYLSLLSWSSPTGEEVLSRDRLVEEMDLGRLGASDVRLDPDKLEWLSGEYIRRMSPEDLALRLVDQFGEEFERRPPAQRRRFASAIKERITTFEGAAEFLPQFYPPNPMEWTADARAALDGEEVLALFEALYAMLKGVEDWEGETVITAIRTAGKQVGLKGRHLFMPVRAAITGSTRGPELVDVFEIQGKATALRVLEQAIATARSQQGES